MILSHHKELNRGTVLFDDGTANGAAGFEGELVRFGTAEFLDWAATAQHLLDRAAGEP